MVFFPQGIFLTFARKLKERRERKAVSVPLEVPYPQEVPPPPAVEGAGDGTLILEARGVTKSFGGVNAVSDLSFSMERGQLRALIGPNGAGKSTFFSLLTGIHDVDSGTILLNGKEITRAHPYQRIRMGISLKFQTNRTYKNLTAAENLQVARAKDRTGGADDKLEWGLRAFGLDKRLHLPVRSLTHGHQQWLEICLALATNPDLLLLDEPTTGMTPEETSRTAEFVKALNSTGMSILVVEHDMSFVREIGSRVTILHNGKLFAEGTLGEIESSEEVKRIYLGE
jgi:branched-chain amino acid transport system ATP-binding protein